MTDKTDIAALRGRLIAIADVEELHSFAIYLIDQLEAERQRADANEPARCEGVPQHVHDMIDMQETIDELRAEIAALKAKLANPIVLPKRSVDEVMIMSGFDRQYAEGWVSANDNGIYEINAAGFTVKGE